MGPLAGPAVSAGPLLGDFADLQLLIGTRAGHKPAQIADCRDDDVAVAATDLDDAAPIEIGQGPANRFQRKPEVIGHFTARHGNVERDRFPFITRAPIAACIGQFQQEFAKAL